MTPIYTWRLLRHDLKDPRIGKKKRNEEPAKRRMTINKNIGQYTADSRFLGDNSLSTSIVCKSEENRFRWHLAPLFPPRRPCRFSVESLLSQQSFSTARLALSFTRHVHFVTKMVARTCEIRNRQRGRLTSFCGQVAAEHLLARDADRVANGRVCRGKKYARATTDTIDAVQRTWNRQIPSPPPINMWLIEMIL